MKKLLALAFGLLVFLWPTATLGQSQDWTDWLNPKKTQPKNSLYDFSTWDNQFDWSKSKQESYNEYLDPDNFWNPYGKSPLNSLKQFDQNNPLNPLNSLDPQNPLNGFNRYNNSSPLSIPNRYKLDNPLNPLNAYRYNSAFDVGKTVDLLLLMDTDQAVEFIKGMAPLDRQRVLEEFKRRY